MTGCLSFDMVDVCLIQKVSVGEVGRTYGLV